MLKTVGNPSTRYGDQTILSGNLVIGTSGNGIDFSANANAPGATSELLSDYEQGTWTPTDGSGAVLTFSSVRATYVKIGRMVYCQFRVTYPATADVSNANISGLPFAAGPGGGVGAGISGFVGFSNGPVTQLSGSDGGTNFYLYTTSSNITNAQMSGKLLWGQVVYQAQS